MFEVMLSPGRPRVLCRSRFAAARKLARCFGVVRLLPLVAAIITQGCAGGADRGGVDQIGPMANITVAQDGTGDFSTIAAALASLDPGGKERIVILVRNGVYNEHLAIRRSCVTLRGQSRRGTRIELALTAGEAMNDPFGPGRGVVNIYGDDVTLENLTVANTQTQRTHAFAVRPRHAHDYDGLRFSQRGERYRRAVAPGRRVLLPRAVPLPRAD